MRVGVIAETPSERGALSRGIVPVPLIESWFSFMLARTLMVATRCGVFDALAHSARTDAQIAKQCGTALRSTSKLLHALEGSGYLRRRGGRWALTPLAQRFLPRDVRGSLHDKLLFQFLEWKWWEHCEQYVRTGKPLEIHRRMSPQEWGLYQRGMRAGKEAMAEDVAGRVPVPSGARNMLDIGGSHGLYSVAFCRRHRGLHATILDLKSAVRHAAPLLAREGMGDRVVHRVGDVLRDDLGHERFDFVWMASLVHHFDEKTNRALVRRIARSLRPGGRLAILEVPRASSNRGQMGALMDLYFAMTSQSGTWSTDEIASWQRDAGLVPARPIHLRVLGYVAVQSATKPARRTRSGT